MKYANFKANSNSIAAALGLALALLLVAFTATKASEVDTAVRRPLHQSEASSV